LPTPLTRSSRSSPTCTAAKGLSHDLAAEVAVQLTAVGRVRGRTPRVELGINPTNLTSPWQRSLRIDGSRSRFGSLLRWSRSPCPLRICGSRHGWSQFLLALAVTGVVSARIGSTPLTKPFWRNVLVARGDGCHLRIGALVGP